MATVREIMSTHLITIGVGDSLADARALMDKFQVRHLPVLDAGNAFAGLLTERDLLAATGSAADAAGITVETAMNRAVTGVDPDVDLAEAGRHLLEHKHGCLPVVEAGNLVGLVTEADFVALALRQLEG